MSVSYTPPKVVAVFLAKFDVRLGYQMVWSRGELPLDGIEYKALPSGVHECSAATIYLTHECGGELHYGMARYHSLNLNLAGGTDRALVRMYSLGILTEPPAVQWKPNAYASGGWEHLGAVDAAVRAYAADENPARLEQMWRTFRSPRAALADTLQVPGEAADAVADLGAGHPLMKTAAVLAAVGPLIFPIYKAALLRQLVLIFNHPGEAGAAETDAAEPERGDPYALCGALAYLVSVLSVVPQDVRFEPRDDTHLLSSQPLYTVGLHDIDSGVFAHHPGFVATTSDEILKHQRLLYDVAVQMPAAPAHECKVYASADGARAVRATFNDYGKFRRVYRRLPDVDDGDAGSVHTASLIFLVFRRADERADAWEPAWWLRGATLPMSWREYIWLAFAWFASAGTTDRRVGDGAGNGAGNGASDGNAHSLRLQLVRLTHVVGYFHKLTKKWFYIIEEIVAEAVEEERALHKITLVLTHQDIADMELDPYAEQDLAFVRLFVLLYWGLVVEEVHIGLGFQRFLC